MNILLFLAVLVVLIVVHEMGHFLAAKMFGIKVEEFGIGYPPRAWRFGKIGETVYTLNWLPFGGFVKIFGEGLGDEVSDEDKERALVTQKKWKQIIVFIAGVAFNTIFAFVLFSIAFMMGSSVAIDEKSMVENHIERTNTQLMITGTLKGSPAQNAGMKAGDVIESITANNKKIKHPLPSELTDIIYKSGGQAVHMNIVRGVGEKKEIKEIDIIPTHGIMPGKQSTPAIGTHFVLVTEEKYGILKSISLGAEKTVFMSKAIFSGIVDLAKSVSKGSTNWDSVAGPVGIVKYVGDASTLGVVHLINFVAIISVNLAIVNLIPIPALDGGRILFVLIEGVMRRKVSPAFVNIVNVAGFLLIILLMVVITYHDILNLVS